MEGGVNADRKERTRGTVSLAVLHVTIWTRSHASALRRIEGRVPVQSDRIHEGHAPAGRLAQLSQLRSMTEWLGVCIAKTISDIAPSESELRASYGEAGSITRPQIPSPPIGKRPWT
jgi:hypothetical protein